MAFPNARRARVLAVAVEPAEPLARAAAAVERGCVAAGFEPEARPFRGHLTLGRIKRGRPPRFDDVTIPDHEPTPVRDAVLFRSELGPDGSRYVPLERVAFRASDAPGGGGANDSEPRL
jgi:2'-5' RNA ligase